MAGSPQRRWRRAHLRCDATSSRVGSKLSEVQSESAAVDENTNVYVDDASDAAVYRET